MPELPNLLRQRLALAESADSHPDADTLNAYAEKLLPAPERSRILEHIAACSECRDVIALSLEPSPDEANITAVPVAPSLPRARRAWAPLFGLAASFAAMAIVAVLIVKQPQKGNQSPLQSFEQAKLAAPQAPSLPPAVEPIPPKTQPSSSSRPAAGKESTSGARRAEARRDVDGALMADREAASPVPPVVVSSNTATVEAITASVAVSPRRAYLNDNLFRPGDRGQNAVDVAEIPNSQGSLSVPAQFQGFAGNVQLHANADLPVPAPGSKPVWTASPSSGRSVTFLTPFKQAARRIIVPPISAAGLMAKAMGAPDGQFNPAKDLQSVEVGSSKRKETPELDQTQAFTAPAIRTKAAGSSTTGHLQTSWAVGNGKLLRTDDSGAWVSGYAGNENIDFTAVTAHGADVWAGGNHAALLHSRDGGVTWERLRLGLNETGSVTSILATGQSIQVTTSENQTWSSEDSGKSWTQN